MQVHRNFLNCQCTNMRSSPLPTLLLLLLCRGSAHTKVLLASNENLFKTAIARVLVLDVADCGLVQSVHGVKKFFPTNYAFRGSSGLIISNFSTLCIF